MRMLKFYALVIVAAAVTFGVYWAYDTLVFEPACEAHAVAEGMELAGVVYRGRYGGQVICRLDAGDHTYPEVPAKQVLPRSMRLAALSRAPLLWIAALGPMWFMIPRRRRDADDPFERLRHP